MAPRFRPRFLIAAMVVLSFIFLPSSFVVADTADSSLTTLFASDNQYAGNMFDLTVLAAHDIAIHSFDVNITSDYGKTAGVSVYYRLGGYAGYTSDPSAWTLAGTVNVVSNGLNVPTPVSVGDIILTAGETYGFYITVNNYHRPDTRMYYTEGTSSYQNDDLLLTGSIGRGTPVFTGIQTAGRIWNGTIYYSVYTVSAPVPTVIPQTGDCAGAFLLLWVSLAVFSASAIILLRRKGFSK